MLHVHTRTVTELDAAELRELHADLAALRAELQSFLEASSAGSAPVALDEPIGRLSRMDAMQQQAMSSANRRTAEQRLQRVEAALQRAPDEYGLCLHCEEPVGFKRLKVQPDAVLCFACQSDRETGP